MLISLLRSQYAGEIIIHEPEPEIGPGLPYGAAAPWHQLNVIATRASLREEDPDHWWQWAKIHGPALGWPDTRHADSHSYLPRRLFGHYIRFELAEARRGNPHATVTHERSPVVSIEEAASGFLITSRDGLVSFCDSVVLAIGAPSPNRLQVPGAAALRAAGRWIDDPWDPVRLRALPPDQPVLIVGSALTMADTVVSLRQLGHCGQILVLSRHGIVPEERREQPTRPSGLSADLSVLPLSTLLRQLRHAVALHGQDRWQGVFEDLRSYSNALWCGLPTEARRQFMRHLRPYWDAHRFRMPPETAQIVTGLRAAGILRVLKGRLNDVALTGDGIRARAVIRGQGGIVEMQASAVIDCTGPRQSDNDWAGGLLEQMQQHGMVQTSPCGIGIHATPEGEILASGDRIVPGLYGLGPALRGTLLETTAIAEIRQQASMTAERLVDGWQIPGRSGMRPRATA